MAKLKTDCPLSRRIVLSFLDFLNFVEPASDVDREGIEVAKECLSEAFKIKSSSVDRAAKSLSLVDIFSSLKAAEQPEIKADINHHENSADPTSTSSTHTDSKSADPSHSLDEDRINEVQNLGITDELFWQYFGALENIHYFGISPDGQEDQVQLDRATSLFHNALMEMQKSGCETFDQKNLAETFKVQGNKAMQSKLYPDAIEFYTIAIALRQDNAIYYCNRLVCVEPPSVSELLYQYHPSIWKAKRFVSIWEIPAWMAAAYTQINKYEDAIRDCYQSIAIDPNYSKAYSRLGFAYYAQGNYRDSIDKGFIRALHLDPNNSSVKENIQAAEQKLREQQRAGYNQNASSGSHSYEFAGGESFNVNGISVDVTTMVRNMTTNVFHQGTEGANNTTETFSEPEIRVGGGNINVNLGEEMPEDISGALRSVMQMFSGGGASFNSSAPTPDSNSSQDNLNGRSPPN